MEIFRFINLTIFYYFSVKKFSYILCFSFLLLLLYININNINVSAQQQFRWTPDERVPGYLDDTFTPYLFADQDRTVHAFANQWVGEANKQLAIVYRQWSLDGGWTNPVDVLLSPVGDARIIGAFLSQDGMMHVAFWGGDDQKADIFYSKAPAANAGRAPVWSTPVLVGENPDFPPSGALAGDDKGNLVILFSGNIDGNGIFEVHSSDGGDSWSIPEPVFLTDNPGLIPYSVNVYMSQAGQLHAVWNVVTSTGEDMAMYYARLDIAHQQWSDPVLLDKRIEKEGFFGPSFPVIVDNGNTLVVMYNSGNLSSSGTVAAGRPVMMVRQSHDGGNTWSNPTVPFPRHLGRSGEHSLVVDSDNVVHAIFMQRIELTVNGKYTVIDGPWHSELRNNQWSEPQRFSTKWSPHDMRAVISQGNILLAAWRADPGVGQYGVWYSYKSLDSQELPVVPLPLAPTLSVSIPQPTSTPINVNPQPSPESLLINQNEVSPGYSNNPASPLILGIAPVVLILVGVIFVQRLSLLRRK